MAKYVVRKEAHNDLKKIGRYTANRWNEKQRNAYLKQITSRFSWLAEHPQLGRKRDEIKEGYYSYSEGRHMIFYVVKDGIVEIIRVLHKQMDVERIIKLNVKDSK
jgi:toxin ParE1/3/4